LIFRENSCPFLKKNNHGKIKNESQVSEEEYKDASRQTMGKKYLGLPQIYPLLDEVEEAGLGNSPIGGDCCVKRILMSLKGRYDLNEVRIFHITELLSNGDAEVVHIHLRPFKTVRGGSHFGPGIGNLDPCRFHRIDLGSNGC
jgi:hypothetical protein